MQKEQKNSHNTAQDTAQNVGQDAVQPAAQDTSQTAAQDAAQEEFWVDLPAPVREVVEEMHASGTDPQGSWTGLPAGQLPEAPVQDADDL